MTDKDLLKHTSQALDDLLKTMEDSPEPSKKTESVPAKKTEPEPEPEPTKTEPDSAASPADDKSTEPAPPSSDDFESVELPAYAKPQTKDSFAKLKEIGRRKVAEAESAKAAALADRDAKVAELEKQRKELEEKVKGYLPPEKAQELEELRKWRASVEVEKDPSFQTYDDRIQRNVETIYERFKAAGMTEEQLKEMKRLGGPEKVDVKTLYQHLDQSTAREIEADLIENRLIRKQKAEALEQAKKNAHEFLDQRRKAHEGVEKEVHEKTRTITKTYLDTFDWAKEQAVPVSAKADEKARIEAQNKFAKETQDRVKKMLEDNTPETRAEMVVGTALAYYYKALADYRETAIKALEKKVSEASGELDRIKKASGASRRTSTPHVPVKPQFKDQMVLRTEDALDKLRDELEGRE